MKALLLARVSSKEQEEGQSIPAQERRLREYAERKGLIVEEVFKITESSTKNTRKEFEKIREYKKRQIEIAEEMKNHEKADQNFYITANMVMNLAARAREIFESSEVDEKRELLNLVFQNLKLEGKKMLTEIREPFSTMIGYKDCPTNWRWRELNSRPKQTTY